MKKRIFLLIHLILALCLMVSCQISDGQNDIINSCNIPSNTDGIKDEYQYKIVDNAVEIIAYKDKDSKNIIIPEMIAGSPVEILGEDAFYQCKNATSIILPQTLTTLDGSPFYRCYSLQQIIIPRNVKTIEVNPFFRCSSLEMVFVDPQNDKFSSVDGVLFNKEESVLIAYPEGNKRESYTIPSSVKKLNIDSFGYHTKLRKLTIMSNVVEFPDGNMFVFPNDIVLVIESGSVAEEYVKKHSLKFEYR